MLLITLNENTLSLSPGSQVIFPHQTWEDYERLLSLRLQKTYPKLYFWVPSLRVVVERRGLTVSQSKGWRAKKLHF